MWGTAKLPPPSWLDELLPAELPSPAQPGSVNSQWTQIHQPNRCCDLVLRLRAYS